MHEYAIVQSLFQEVLRRAEEEKAKRVPVVRFRRGSAFSEGALRQGFEAISAGTVLEGARLEIETVNLEHKCSCGRTQVVNSDDLVGHMFVCPACGTIREIEQAHDIELIEAVFEQE